MKATFSKLAILMTVLSMAGILLGSQPALADGAKGSGVVNINTADAKQLELLPGIGKAKARAILNHRARQRFSSPEDLTKVKGIGKGLLDKLRKRVVVKGKTTARASARKKPVKRKK